MRVTAKLASSFGDEVQMTIETAVEFEMLVEAFYRWRIDAPADKWCMIFKEPDRKTPCNEAAGETTQ
jgi:hypothetical protein